MSKQSQYATINKNVYNNLNYDKVTLVLKHSLDENKNKPGLQKLAAMHQMSVNAFLIYCINTVAGEEVVEPLDNYSRRPMQVARIPQ